MKNHNGQNINPQFRQRLKTAFTLAGISFLVATLLVILPQLIPHKSSNGNHVYYFSPIEDNQYANPSNWSPSYPGTYIFKDQKVVIQGLTNLPFYDIQVEGEIELGLDSKIFSPANGLVIKEGGKVHNHGDIVVAHIIQEGHFNNNFTGRVDAFRFETGKHSKTFNLVGGEVTIKENLLNRGYFNNYGHVHAQHTFQNTSQFYQLGSSSLTVKGQIYSGAVAGVLP